MPDPTDFEQFPVFGDNSSKVQPGDQKYAAGFQPGDVLPAEWLNWFLNTGTKGYNELVDAVCDPDVEGKTIDSADNTVLFSPVIIDENTTLNFTTEAAVTITALVTLTLGTAPYFGYKVKVMNGRSSGVVYVHYNGLESSQFDDAIYTGDSITYEYYGSGTWKPMDGTVFRAFSSLPSTYNEWKTYRGPGTYTFFYSYTGAATDHDLPSSFCTVTVVWGSSTTASASAVQNYHSAGNESTAVTMWTRNLGASTWSKWFKIAPGGSGAVTTKTTYSTGFSGGSINYCVQNRMCTVGISGVKATSSTATGQTVLTGLPKAKFSTYGTSNVSGALWYIAASGTKLLANPVNTTSSQYAAFTYQVADDWVEP